LRIEVTSSVLNSGEKKSFAKLFFISCQKLISLLNADANTQFSTFGLAFSSQT
jgi:hypothetical protein